eukprot:scaffold45060_cov48-Phaeocystis_antarctica.AAC.1
MAILTMPGRHARRRGAAYTYYGYTYYAWAPRTASRCRLYLLWLYLLCLGATYGVEVLHGAVPNPHPSPNPNPHPHPHPNPNPNPNPIPRCPHPHPNPNRGSNV